MSVVIDDEKYFTLSTSDQLGNSGYYTDNKSSTPEDVRFKKKSKYEPKVLVWVAFSEDGIAEPFIQESSIAIDAERYINKCLKPKLFKFIRSWYNHDEYVFWPDLASAHYANTTIETLKANKIVFVSRGDNPPNVPQARPIEKFWAHVCSKVYQHGWQAKTKRQLI